jgi:hypothetical protein
MAFIPRGLARGYTTVVETRTVGGRQIVSRSKLVFFFQVHCRAPCGDAVSLRLWSLYDVMSVVSWSSMYGL